jgi:hypothetical protein
MRQKAKEEIKRTEGGEKKVDRIFRKGFCSLSEIC